MPSIDPILGAILLFFGRSFYWVFIAIAGFLVGVELANVTLADQSQLVRVLAAAGGGLLGALLSMVAQRVGFAIGGLYAGGYLALSIAREMGVSGDHWLWFGIGGAIGAIIAAWMMDWAIIVLSSLAGAGAIIPAMKLSPQLSAILFVVLAAVGIAVQGRRLPPRAVSHESST